MPERKKARPPKALAREAPSAIQVRPPSQQPQVQTQIVRPKAASPDNEKMAKKTFMLFGYIALLFIVAQLLGIYSGIFIFEDAKTNEVIASLRLFQFPGSSGGTGPAGALDIGSVLYLFAVVLCGALIMVLLIRFYKGRLVFTLLEFAVVSFSSSIVFYSFIKPALAQTYLSMGIAILSGLAFGLLKLFFPKIKNLSAVLATAGAGAVFGFSLSFYSALLFLLLLSLYDYVAVFKTRHMVEMAQTVSKQEMSFVITSRQKTGAGDMSFELGTGDMLIPIVLAVSGSRMGFAYCAIVFAASLCGLLALFVLLSRKKAVLPALPIIAFFNLVFLALSKIAGII